MRMIRREVEKSVCCSGILNLRSAAPNSTQSNLPRQERRETWMHGAPNGLSAQDDMDTHLYGSIDARHWAGTGET